MKEALLSTLRRLRLSGLAQTLEVRLQEAASHNLNHAEFLELILQDELSVRNERLIDRRVKAAGFRELKPLTDFEWSFNPSIKKKQVYDLACCRFIREHRDVLWMGPPGVGKSFLVQALAYEAIKQGFVVLYRSIFDVVRDFLHDEAFGGEERVLARYLKPDLLIIDDMGMKQSIVDPRNWTTTLGRDRGRIGPDLGGLHGSETTTDRGWCEGEGCVGGDAGRPHDEPTGFAVRRTFHADRPMEAAPA